LNCHRGSNQIIPIGLVLGKINLLFLFVCLNEIKLVFFRWLPFLIFGFLSLLIALLICTFPRRIKKIGSPNDSQVSRNKKKIYKEVMNDDENTNNNTNDPNVEMKLLKNDNDNEKVKNETNKLSSSQISLPNLNRDNNNIDKKTKQHHSNSIKTEAGNLILESLDIGGSLLSLNQLGAQSNKAHIVTNNEDQNENLNEKDGYQSVLTDSFHSNLSVTQQAQNVSAPTTRHMIKQALKLLSNPIYIFIIITTAIEGSLIIILL
jgi:hypothetical protein